MIRKIAFLSVLLLPTALWAQDQKPNDAQIAHIAYSAGEIDIAAAHQAEAKAGNADVKKFAEEMARDHKAVNDQAVALLKKLNVTPQDNPTSQFLNKGAAAKQADLAKLTGTAYDRAYMENEVAYHKTVNAALNDTLIPSAQNAELKSLLQTGLNLFQSHQVHAEQILSRLQK